MTRRVLVTGATGFVGEALVPGLTSEGLRVRAATRDGRPVPAAAETVALGDLATLAARPDDARRAVGGCDVVIHAAGLAHQDASLDEAIYRTINRDATVALARAAADAGARFVFVSSIRAQVGPSCPTTIDETTPPTPVDAYGRSKLAAERALADMDGLDAVTVRPVLVHGPGAKGNLASLARVAARPIPLPIASIRAPRSIVARADLVAALALLATAPRLAHRLYIAADPTPLSLADMHAALARAAGRAPLQFPVPAALVGGALRMLGKGELYRRVAEPLVVDPGRLLAEGWATRHPFGAVGNINDR
jgi:UDP-glucose 4-epimerase